MLRCMDSAVAGLRAHQNKMDVVGHNIANVNTFGFKAQTFTFKEAMYQTSTASTGNNGGAGGVNAAQFGYGTMMGTIGVDMTASTPTYKGGFNASINGEGFFITMGSKSPGGSTSGVAPGDFKNYDFMYTRVGQFKLDSEGYVVDSNGNYVYGFQPTDPKDPNSISGTSNLVALRAPKDNSSFSTSTSTSTSVEAAQLSNIEINQNGIISAKLKDTGEIVYLGTVAIATFQNPEGLTKAGENYYTAKDSDNTGQSSATTPGGETSTLMCGYIEASNVDLAQEFSEMITTHRGFQANSKMITVADEMLSDLVNMKR